MPSIRWLGHAAFHITIGGRSVLTDLWLERESKDFRRVVAPAINANDIKRCDVLLLSHEHSDHCSPSDVNDIAARTFAHVVAPASTLAKLTVPQRQRVNVREGDRFTLLGLEIEVTRAEHPQSVEPVGFVIAGEGRRIYFAGDTYEFTNMSSIRCDAALLPIGGTYTMDVLGAVTAAKRIRPRFVIPMHYGTFAAIGGDANDFAARLRKESRVIEPIVLKPGECFNFE